MLSGFLLTGCATSTPEIADSACRSFKPISMSKADTEQTKRQVIGHNRAYDAVCPGQGAPSQKVAANG